ncbi:membrane dipeptidase [Nonomuraea wenchangensis]|uniref:membrane dipeptidase n=2 Tax=Nonomuraea wenchangensis TaxID=568860 RepID=UPI0037A166D8
MTGLFGLADTHVHFRADLGFGGYGIFGQPFSPDGDGLVGAVPHCTGAHGPGGLMPTLDGIGHLVGGWPQFDGWPRHTTQAHQQACLEWIRRAVDGGLRLAVCLAVNNELLARRASALFGHRLDADDTSAIGRQLAGMSAMVRFVDEQCGGPGQGWLEIARTPADARRIVAGGRLALVPGVEVDALGGWHTPQELTLEAARKGRSPRELIAALVKKLHDAGVRHVFPVHATDNAFGGAAIFNRGYDPVNQVLTGESFVVEQAPAGLGISYRLDEDAFDGGGLAERFAYHGLRGLWRHAGPPRPTNWATTPGGHINARGLTEYGAILIEELMKRGMMIDVDHMSHHTFSVVLDLCEARGYPVVSGHTSMRALRHGWRPAMAAPDREATFSRTGDTAAFGTANPRMLSTENNKSPEQLARIRRTGGLVSVFCYQRDIRAADGAVQNDCAGSARSFAQALTYLSEAMGGRRIALGTDVNGVGQLPGPRFGPCAAAGMRTEADQPPHRASRREQVFAQRGGVRYDGPITDYRAHRFSDGGFGAPFTADELEFWEAIAIWRSGTPPDRADRPPWWRRSPWTDSRILNLSLGLAAGSRDEIPQRMPLRWCRPWPLYRTDRALQLAAYLARTESPPRAGDPPATRDLVPALTAVWRHWRRMEYGIADQGTESWIRRRFGPTGSALYTEDGALNRSRAGRRDFDVNLDGMAHYGLLPDFLQDVRNIGVSAGVLDTLYDGAEQYIQVWERCLEQAPQSDCR